MNGPSESIVGEWTTGESNPSESNPSESIADERISTEQITTEWMLTIANQQILWIDFPKPNNGVCPTRTTAFGAINDGPGEALAFAN